MRRAVRGESSDEDEAPDAAPELVKAQEDAGAPLPATLREQLAAVFGVDLDALAAIRVHDGQPASDATEAVGAEAFALGRDIHFATGAYDPDSERGRHLIAHEVAHVLDPSPSPSPSSSSSEPGVRVSQPDDSRERRADVMADAFVAATAASATSESPASGAMDKDALLSLLRAAVSSAVDAELAPDRTSENCPYIAHIFDYYAGRTPEQVQRALRRYVGGGNDDVHGVIARVVERVRLGVRAWRLTDRLPEEAVALAPRLRDAAAEPTAAGVRARLGPGEVLDPAIAAAAGDASGASLGDVRVHTGAEAAALTRAEGAHAVTVGRDIAFAPGTYRPGTMMGDALLAHELAHVVQQSGAPASDADRPLERGGDEAHEDDADEAATSLVARLYGGLKSTVGKIASSVRPAMTSGFRVSRCSETPQTADRQRAAALQRQYGVNLEMTPALAPGQPAVVGMYLTFNIRRNDGRIEPTVFVGEWRLEQPDGQIDWSASQEVVRLQIRQAGPHTMRTKVIVQHGTVGDRQEFPIEHHFTAVTAADRSRDQLTGVADHTYEEMRTPLDIQRAMLDPPGPDGQADRHSDYRINTGVSNPVRVSSSYGSTIPFSIARTAATPAPAGTSYHWYVKALSPETLPYHRDRSRALGTLRPTSLDGQGGYFDLGTGPTAAMPSHAANVFIVICRVLDGAGQRLSEARYAQSILTAQEERDLGELSSYLDRATGLASTINPERRTPLTAVHTAVDSARSRRLELFAGPGTRGGITIIDVTPGLKPEDHQLEFNGTTFADALQQFRERNRHPRGSIVLRVPAQNQLGANGTPIPAAQHTIETNGESELDEWSSRFGLLSLGLFAAAVVAAPFTGGGSIAVTALLIGSAVAGGISAGLSLAERLRHAEVSSTGVALDIVGIVGSIVGAGAVMRGLRVGSQAINVVGHTTRFVLWTNFTTSAVAAILVSVDGIEQIQLIMSNDALTEDQKRALLVRVVTGMALAGAILALSYRDLNVMRSRLRGVLGVELEGALSNEARMTLSLLDDDVLRGLQRGAAGATLGDELEKLARILRTDSQLMRRLAGRTGIIDALRYARAETANELELGLLRVRLARTFGDAHSERIANALRRGGIPGAAADGLSDAALARISSDPERAAALHHRHGDAFLAELRAHPGDALDAIEGRLSGGRASPPGGDGVFELDNTRQLAIAGPGGATSTATSGNLSPNTLNSELRGMAGRGRAHGATVRFERRGSGVETRGQITVTDATGTEVKIDVEVRAVTDLATPGGSAGAEPGRLDLRPPDASNPNWRANITVSNRLRTDDVGSVVGRELDESIDIARRNGRGIIDSEQTSVAFRPGAARVTGPAQTTAADRASMRQLQDLWDDVRHRRQVVDGHRQAGNPKPDLERQLEERSARLDRLLQTMGIDDPQRLSERLPLLRGMGMTDEQWTALQVFVESRRFATVAHPGLTATAPVMTDGVIDHLLHPRAAAGSFPVTGIRGGHDEANMRNFLSQHPEYELVRTRAAAAGGSLYIEYRQYRWKSTTTPPPPIGDSTRPGGATFGTAQQALWDVATPPKTTATNMQAYMRDAEAAWESWRSANSTPGGAAVTPGYSQFTTNPNAAGVRFEGGFDFTPGPPARWELSTIYPKL
jgi:hypothetical protein